MRHLPSLLAGQNGKYLQLSEGGEGLSASSPESDPPQPFHLELRDPTRMRIKTKEGRYVCAEKNGGIAAGSAEQVRRNFFFFWGGGIWTKSIHIKTF